jgi:hypothetical protein
MTGSDGRLGCNDIFICADDGFQSGERSRRRNSPTRLVEDGVVPSVRRLWTL